MRAFHYFKVVNMKTIKIKNIEELAEYLAREHILLSCETERKELNETFSFMKEFHIEHVYEYSKKYKKHCNYRIKFKFEISNYTQSYSYMLEKIIDILEALKFLETNILVSEIKKYYKIDCNSETCNHVSHAYSTLDYIEITIRE